MLGGKGGLTNVTILQQAQEYQRMLIKLSPYLCNFFFYADVCLGALCSFEGNEGTQLQTQTIYQEMFSKKTDQTQDFKLIGGVKGSKCAKMIIRQLSTVLNYCIAI